MTTTSVDLVEEMLRLSELLDEAYYVHIKAIQRWAEAEPDYRRVKATSYLTGEGTVQARQAKADIDSIAEKHEQIVAEGMAKATLELIRSRRTQLSVLQTVANKQRAETEFAARGPEWTP